ncbi:MAG: class I mannose-6-phosphate isomerase [Selenomonadaceae bacterium]|nr:class I mannose-6-phosphate isomerase [Selenomonadaceae bacterium]
MAILKLKPACKDYPWGGRRLAEEFGIEYDKKILAEAWVLSCHPDGASTLEGGGTLADYIKQHGTEILGTNCRRFQDFPILIKFIDAKENLSVQVHPPDDYALANEGQLGKREMWYVLDADKDSVLYCGFNKKISRDEFTARIKDNSLIEVLNPIHAKKGDVIFIPPGTVHAIGGGILTVEIQTNSNVTYRIYDYGRNRPLHISQALAVTNFNPVNVRAENYQHLVACDYFVVDKLVLDGKFLSEAGGTVDEKTFLSVVILDGAGKISCGDEELNYRKGDSFFLTAGAGDWKICGGCHALLTTVPSHE